MAGDDGKKKSPPGDKTDRRRGREEGTLVKERTKTPRKYRVVMHNDDFTPMEFVIHVLESIFRKSKAEATRVMLTVHTEGAATAGTYSREIAETKASKAIALARSEGYPLLVSTELA